RVAALCLDAPDRRDASAERDLLPGPLLVELRCLCCDTPPQRAGDMGQWVRREIEVEQVFLPPENLLLRILRRVHGNEVVMCIICAAEEALLPNRAHLALLLPDRQRAVQRVDQSAAPAQRPHVLWPPNRIESTRLD